ncbi:DNA utilization protein GntX [Mariniblastus fucicola]|uniref:DNA utilization protein GntX n=2 Tax=Mariniblastus fucicola TaxID=980251 RepID=A0A5B9PGD1_9BACT|nr:DNA utilization protein GntX [Mariniblastus fucicola]
MASLLYPAACVGCEEPLPRSPKLVEHGFESNWCDDCWVRLPESWQQGCPKCGSYIKRPASFGDRCALCHDLPLRFDSAVALGNYHGLLKRMILDLKRDMNESLAFQLGRLLGLRLLQQEFFEHVDFLIPVPIHWWRRFKRGFHASAVIAEGVRSTTGVAIADGMLRCERLTDKQGTLSGPKRFSNVKNAFTLKPLVTVEKARVVIVDDVMTSGATLSELAKMLRKSGAASAHCAIVARGTGSFRPRTDG